MIEGYIYPSQKTAMVSSFNSTTITVKDLPKMPYVLKLVEQRMPNGKGPYCEKMKVQDGKLARLSGEKVLLRLTEPEAEAEAAARVRSARFRAKFRARQQEKESSYCRCQWMVQWNEFSANFDACGDVLGGSVPVWEEGSGVDAHFLLNSS
jgi:hypothetical protein